MGRRKLRVMMVDSGASWGGGQIYASRLAAGLISRGHHVTVVCRRKDWLQDRLKELGIPSWPAAPRNSGDLIAVLRMVLALWWGKYDVIHGHFSRDYVPVVLAGKLARRPVVLTRHVMYPMNPYTVRAASIAARVVAVSSAVRKVLVEELGLPAAIVTTLWAGVDVDRFHPREGPCRELAALGIPTDCTVVGTLCRLGEGKGIDTFLKAAALVMKGHPKVHYLLVGDGPEREKFERLASELGIADQVTFTGYRDDTPAVLSEFDIFVLATGNEPFGLVIIEAMACGLPVVAGNSGGPLDIVIHGETGMLYSADDEQALAQALREMLVNPERTRAMGRAARGRAEEQFSQDRMLTEMEAVYDEVVGRLDGQ